VEFVRQVNESPEIDKQIVDELLGQLKATWNLECEAITFFMHCLLAYAGCNIRSFRVFEDLASRIFPAVSPQAAILQLEISAYRFRRASALNQEYPFNDPLILNRISPDVIDIGQFVSLDSSSCLNVTIRARFLSDALLELSKYFGACLPHNFPEFGPVIASFSTSYERNDLFNTSRARMPVKEANQPRHLEAFIAFGSLLVIAFCSGTALPFIVSRVVIRYAFDFPPIPDDFEDCPDANLEPYLTQLDAIRLGVLKMGPFPHRSYFGLPYFPRVFQMMPFLDFKEMIDDNGSCRPYIVFKGMCEVMKGLRANLSRQKVDRLLLTS
jgi:hypothetical protein